jgi:hypothetical protein
MKKIILILSICLIIFGCNKHQIDPTVAKTDTYLENDELIWPPIDQEGEIRIKAKFKEQIEIQKRKKGDWYHYLYKIVFNNIEVLKGKWRDSEISFLCKDTWPTEKSGIMVKKLAWPFRKNESLIFEIKQNDNRHLIIGYYKPKE